MTVHEKLNRIKENTPKVHQAGKADQLKAMWDFYQQNGERYDYDCAFAGRMWTADSFKPTYNLTPYYANLMFMWMNMQYDYEDAQIIEPLDLVERLNEQGVTLDFSKCKWMFHTFSAANISHVGVIDFKSVTDTSSFYDRDGNEYEDGKSHSVTPYPWAGVFCNSFITKIDKLIFYHNNPPFNKNWLPPSLVDVTCEGTILKGGLDMSYCEDITRDSIMQFINVLADFSSDQWKDWKAQSDCTVILGADNLAKLSADDIAVATNKGWTLVGAEE